MEPSEKRNNKVEELCRRFGGIERTPIELPNGGNKPMPSESLSEHFFSNADAEAGTLLELSFLGGSVQVLISKTPRSEDTFSGEFYINGCYNGGSNDFTIAELELEIQRSMDMARGMSESQEVK